MLLRLTRTTSVTLYYFLTNLTDCVGVWVCARVCERESGVAGFLLPLKLEGLTPTANWLITETMLLHLIGQFFGDQPSPWLNFLESDSGLIGVNDPAGGFKGHPQPAQNKPVDFNRSTSSLYCRGGTHTTSITTSTSEFSHLRSI